MPEWAAELVSEVQFGLADLFDLRRIVTSAALDAGLSARRGKELALALNEVAVNAIVHGRPPATLRVWRGQGEVVCEVTDAGDGIQDPMAGRIAPPADAPSGRGLWVARNLCDAVEIRNDRGCTVSLHMAGGLAVPV